MTNQKAITEIIRNRKKAEDTVYTDRHGKTHTEVAGKYSPALTNAVGSDIFYASVLGNVDHAKAVEVMQHCHTVLQELNLALLRRYDDFKAKRELINYDYEKASRLIKEIIDNRQDIPDDLAKAAMQRLLIMNNWAYCLEADCLIKEDRFMANIREYDSDGNLVSPVDDQSEHIIQELCKIRQLLIQILLKTDVFSDDYHIILDKMELLTALSKALLEGSGDTLSDAILAGNRVSSFEEFKGFGPDEA